MPGKRLPAEWEAAGDLLRVRVAGRPAAEYRSGRGLPETDSPRPHLHEVRSPGGALVTEAHPADHPHHLGLSVAIPDVDGVSYWGGRTFVRDAGPTLLDNHGTQHRVALDRDRDTVHETLEWRDPSGRRQLSERRRLRVGAVGYAGRDALAVELHSILAAPEGEASIGSPATNGRPGAAYGGPFWRLPHRAGSRILTPEGEGETLAHESRAPWVAVVSEEVSVVFRQPEGALPWFVRGEEYLGVGASIAVAERVTVRPGAPLVFGIAATVVDGALSAEEVAAAEAAGAGVAGSGATGTGAAGTGALGAETTGARL